MAEDIVQTVPARAYQQWERVAAADSPHAYLRRMIVNEYVSWRRKWHRVIPTSELETLIAQVRTMPRHMPSGWHCCTW